MAKNYINVAYATLTLFSLSNAPIHPVNTNTRTLPTPQLLKCTLFTSFYTHSLSPTGSHLKLIKAFSFFLLVHACCSLFVSPKDLVVAIHYLR